MKTITILNSMKSRCFMLVAYVTLLWGASACSNEEFGVEVPEAEKVWTKQELIEQALSRMPQTRVESRGIPVQMVTIKKTVSIKCKASGSMTIDWGYKDYTTTISPNTDSVYTFTYLDDRPSHGIRIMGYPESIQELNVDSNRLIFLEVDAPKLSHLYCHGNNLDELDLTNCPNLIKADLINNELTSIDISSLSKLQILWVSHNYLRKIDVTQNNSLMGFSLDDNQIEDIDLTGNPNIIALGVGDNPIKDLDIHSNLKLQYISINNLSLNSLNGISVDTENFDEFKKYAGLTHLFIAYTPIKSLDLSQNSLKTLDISGTAITQLDISKSKIITFYATRSQLTELTYSQTTFNNAQDIRLERTPFERDEKSMSGFINKLPDRKGMSNPGILYTYSNNVFLTNLMIRNWIVNP